MDIKKIGDDIFTRMLEGKPCHVCTCIRTREVHPNGFACGNGLVCKCRCHGSIRDKNGQIHERITDSQSIANRLSKDFKKQFPVQYAKELPDFDEMTNIQKATFLSYYWINSNFDSMSYPIGYDQALGNIFIPRVIKFFYEESLKESKSNE